MLFVALSLAASALSWLSRPAPPRHGQPFSFWAAASIAFVAWRVFRGSSVLHVIALFGSAAQYLATTLAVARNWDLAVAALIVISAVQVMVLVSPQVVARAGRMAAPEHETGWTGLVTMLRRPPGWVVAWGALIGVLLTLACLGNMTWVTITARRCSG